MNKVVYEGNYFIITEKKLEGRKTPILNIIGSYGDDLGEIKWYGAWRKFCFYPNSNTIWDNKCLEELLNFITEYNSKWRSSK